MNKAGLTFYVAPNAGVRKEPAHLLYHRKGLAERVNRFALGLFQTVYRPEVIMCLLGARLSFKALKTTLFANPALRGRLALPIGAIGLLSAEKLIFLPYNLSNNFQEFNLSYLCWDKEGMGFHAVNFLQTIGDALDSAITLSNSLHDIYAAIPVSQVLNDIFFPLTFAALTVDIAMQSVRAVKTYMLMKKLEADFAGYVEGFKRYNKTEGGEKELLKIRDRRARQLTAYSSKKVCEVVKSGNLEAASQVVTYLKRKLMTIAATQSINVLTVMAITLLFFATVAPYIPLGLLALCIFFKLGLYLYENRMMTKDLPALA